MIELRRAVLLVSKKVELEQSGSPNPSSKSKFIVSCFVLKYALIFSKVSHIKSSNFCSFLTSITFEVGFWQIWFVAKVEFWKVRIVLGQVHQLLSTKSKRTSNQTKICFVGSGVSVSGTVAHLYKISIKRDNMVQNSSWIANETNLHPTGQLTIEVLLPQTESEGCHS